METKTYNSSAITSSQYDAETLELQITFTTGKTYLYEGVPYNDYIRFTDAKSVGKSFSESIAHYDSKKI